MILACQDLLQFSDMGIPPPPPSLSMGDGDVLPPPPPSLGFGDVPPMPEISMEPDWAPKSFLEKSRLLKPFFHSASFKHPSP